MLPAFRIVFYPLSVSSSRRTPERMHLSTASLFRNTCFFRSFDVHSEIGPFPPFMRVQNESIRGMVVRTAPYERSLRGPLSDPFIFSGGLMHTFSSLERLVWFHEQVRKELYPTATALAERFECSPRTAKRIIAFLRDRLHAPLEHDVSRRGYRYADPKFSLAFFEVTQEELLSLLVARGLLEPSAGGAVSRAFRDFSRRLAALSSELGLGPERIEACFSTVWPGFAPAEETTFRNVLKGMLDCKVLDFTYRSPLNDLPEHRTVEPHHLQHYLGSWVLLARCRTRNDWRRFCLSRMELPFVREEAFQTRSADEWKPLVCESFGLFQGGTITEAVLRFNRFRAAWIKEQIWHPNQKIRELPDGGLELRLPVSDLREIKLRVLQYGADVEVLAPEELRREVVEEIGRMTKIYKL